MHTDGDVVVVYSFSEVGGADLQIYSMKVHPFLLKRYIWSIWASGEINLPGVY